MTGSIRIVPQSTELAAMAVVGGAAMVAAVAVFGAQKPLYLAAALIGGLGLVYAALRPVVALVVMVVIEVSNVSGVLESHGNVPVFQASVLMGLLAVVIGLRDPILRGRLNVWTAICAGLMAVLLVTQVVALLDTVELAASLSWVRRLAIDLLFLLVLLILTQMTARPWAVVTAMVAVLTALSALTIIDYAVFGGSTSFGGFSIVTTSSGELVTTPRYGGPLPDSNFWGRHLTMGLPLAAALLTRSIRSVKPHKKWAVSAVALSILCLLVGIYLTQSRGTFLSAGIAIAVWFIVSEPSVRRWGLASLPVAMALLFVPGVGNRLQDMFSQISRGQGNSHVDPSLLGRLAAQEQAAMMWAERPYFGFGPGTFSGQVAHFAGRVPTAVREPNNAPHNVYLQMLAESGVFGLIGWTVMVLGFLTVLGLRIITLPRARDRVLAAGLIAAIVGYSVSSIALHLAYFRTFAIVLAVVPALAPAWPVSAATMRAFFRDAGVWLLGLAVGGGLFWGCLAASSTKVYRATQHVTVVPVQPIDGWYAYALDVRSRVEMLPTIAKVVQANQPTGDVDADPVRGLLTFVQKGDSPTQARDRVQLAIADGETRFHQASGRNQYTFEVIGSMQITLVRDRSSTALLGSLCVGLVGGLLAALALSSCLPEGARRSRPLHWRR